MTASAEVMTASADGLYGQLSRFYARQLLLIDDDAVDECALTFTADSVLVRDAQPERMRAAGATARREGRVKIAEGLARTVRARKRAGITRRHWLSDLRVLPGPEGGARTRFYLVAVDTPAGGRPAPRNSTVVEDELRCQDGTWRVHRRQIRHDDVDDTREKAP
jgi:hypothetical protein